MRPLQHRLYYIPVWYIIYAHTVTHPYLRALVTWATIIPWHLSSQILNTVVSIILSHQRSLLKASIYWEWRPLMTRGYRATIWEQFRWDWVIETWEVEIISYACTQLNILPFAMFLWYKRNLVLLKRLMMWYHNLSPWHICWVLWS